MLKKILILILFNFVIVAHAQASYIVVNKNNKLLTEDKEAVRTLIKDVYYKERSNWDSGVEVKAYLPSVKSKEFSVLLNYLGTNRQEYMRYWTSKKSREGAAPPKVLKSQRLLINKIKHDPGAVGIISIKHESDIPKSLKAIVHISL